MKKFSLTDLLIFILSAELGGAITALFSGGFTEQYSKLIKPPLSPPPIVFLIVWPILYALMGISAYLIWYTKSKKTRSAQIIYSIQLALNFSWSIITFRFEALLLSSVLSIILLVFVSIMIYKFKPLNHVAAIIQIPYLIWCLFATYLIFATYILNKQ